MAVNHIYFQDLNPSSNTCGEFTEELVKSDCTPIDCSEEPGEPFYVQLFYFSTPRTNGVTITWHRGIEWNDFDEVWVSTNADGTDAQQIHLDRDVEQSFIFDSTYTRFYIGVVQRGKDLAEARSLALEKYNNASLSHTLLPYFSSTSASCVLDNNIVYHTDDINILKSTLTSNQIIFPSTIKPDYAQFGIDYLFDGIASYVSNEGVEYTIHISTPQNDYNMRNTTYVSMSWERARLPETTEFVDINYKLGFSRIPVDSPIYAEDWAKEFMSDKKWTTSIYRFPDGSREYRTTLGYR